MSQMLYRVINPPITWLLKSPLHGVMSSNTLIVEFKGRRSNRIMSTPVSYHRSGHLLHSFTSRQGIWWRNLESGEVARLLVQGQWHIAQPQVILGVADIEVALDQFLRAVPRDASHSNVRLEKDGSPRPVDVQRASGELVLLKFKVTGQK